MTYAAGEIYSGEWYEGEKHGQGSLKSEKKYFMGVWKNGNLVKINSETV